MIGGIYSVRNTVTGERYIGRTACFETRFSQHRQRLQAHSSRRPMLLQKAWDQYGAAAFAFEALVICAPESAVELEQRLLDAGEGEYNRSRSARLAVAKGQSLTPEHRAAIGDAQRGMQKSAEHCANNAAAQRGKTLPAVTREKISAAMRGTKRGPYSPEHCAAMSAGRRAALAERNRRASHLQLQAA